MTYFLFLDLKMINTMKIKVPKVQKHDTMIIKSDITLLTFKKRVYP